MEKNAQRITKKDKQMIDNLDYEGIKFPILKKDYCKIERQNNICINVFCYESRLIIQFMYQIESLKIVWIYY